MKLTLDKVTHFFAGYAICITWFMFTHNILVAFLVAALIAALKELVWDWLLKKGTPEWADFIVTLIGGVVAVIVITVHLIMMI